jgi:hypothetical protein
MNCSQPTNFSNLSRHYFNLPSRQLRSALKFVTRDHHSCSSCGSHLENLIKFVTTCGIKARVGLIE